MRKLVKPIFVSALNAVAVLFLALALAGAGVVRADDNETIAAARPEMVLVSPITLEALEQRISRLEETITSLSEPRQRVSPRQLCVADDSGAETCITKPQLDALLAGQARAAEAAHPATLAGAEDTPSAKEPAAPTASDPEFPTPAVSNEQPTGSIATGTFPAAGSSVLPGSEIEGLEDGC